MGQIRGVFTLTEEKSSEGFRLFQFLGDVKAELRKVTWPTRRELVTYTGVTGLAVVIVCALVWICDTIFARLFQLILR